MTFLTSVTRVACPPCLLFVIAFISMAPLDAQHTMQTPLAQQQHKDAWNQDTWPADLVTPPSPSSQPISGTVSIARLEHPIPAKAVSEFVRASHDGRQGRIREAVTHLEKAIRIAPSYMEAHNNLGVRYLLLGEYERGAQEFQRALQLDPSSVFAHTNLSLARFAQKQYSEAEGAARAALRLDAKFTRAQYVLGLALAAEGKDAAGAVDHLDKAATEFPRARLVAAELLASQGAASGAAAELRAYLTLPDAARRDEVKSWLAQLEP